MSIESSSKHINMEHEVVSNRKLNYKFHLLTLRAPSSFSFKTGQFVVLKINDSIFRCYSIASSPEKLPFWEIFVDITPQGPGTRYLSKLKSKDKIEVTKVAGLFSLQSRKSKQIIFAATGCGLAALKPMIEESLRKDNSEKAILLWGLRYEKDIVFKKLLAEWKKRYPQFTYIIILSQPKSQWKGERGHITKRIVNLAIEEPKTSIYLCGGSDFIEETQDKLQKNSFSSEKIYFERCY